MNAYLDIFSDVLRLVTFQQPQRPMRREFPELDGAFVDRARQPRTSRTAATNYGYWLPAGRQSPGR